MKTIYQNAQYKEATEQLAQLSEAHAASLFEESALVVQLNDKPEDKPSALDRARAMLTGGTPAPRQDRDGLGFRLTECRERLALLGAAITEQRGIMAGLAGLRDAMQAEQGIRAELAAGGYQCSLEVMARPELNFDDSQATISRFARDVDAYLNAHELSAAKSVNVRLLFATGDSLPGDVVTMTGHEAAALVRSGHAEQTRDKPSRVTRPVRESYGQSMETALS